MAYSDKVLDHYENPRNVGSFDKGDGSIGTGMVGAPACGDVMKLQIKVNEEGVIEGDQIGPSGPVATSDAVLLTRPTSPCAPAPSTAHRAPAAKRRFRRAP